MEVKLGQIYAARDALQKLADLKTLPGLVTYEVSKMIALLIPELNHFEKTREALVEKYGEVDEKLNQKKVKPENMVDFSKELSEISTKDVVINREKVLLPSSIEGFSASEFLLLDHFFGVKDDQEKKD